MAARVGRQPFCGKRCEKDKQAKELKSLACLPCFSKTSKLLPDRAQKIVKDRAKRITQVNCSIS